MQTEQQEPQLFLYLLPTWTEHEFALFVCQVSYRDGDFSPNSYVFTIVLSSLFNSCKGKSKKALS